MKIKDIIKYGNYSEVEFRAYKQDGVSDFFYDLVPYSNGNFDCSGSNNVYTVDDDIINYDDGVVYYGDNKYKNRLVVWIRTILSDKIHTNYYGDMYD